MAKAKKTKPREQVRWRVSLMTKTPARFIYFAYAPDAETAEKQVAKEHHEISETLRTKLVAIRDDL
jgi:polyhydroxyalkanoate synthesis regulator protein